MKTEQLISLYPVLYHMAEDGSWESIQERGLLSTSALLDLFEIHGERRYTIESRWRPDIVRIEHPAYGEAFVRDQKTMPENLLLRCLEGMAPQDWYETLNRKVFFWADKNMPAGRLMRFLNAYDDKPRIVLTVDTAGLLERHAEMVMLSHINSGAPFHGNPSPRGTDTFRRIADFPPIKRVAEVVVEGAVPHIRDFILGVGRWQGTNLLETMWVRPD